MPILTNKLGLTSYNTVTDASSVSFYTFFNQSSGSATTQNLGILDRYATDTSACIARGFAESSASTTILSASVAILNGDVVKVRFLNSAVPPTPSTGCSILYFDTSGSMHAFNSGSNINITNTLMQSSYQKFDRKGDLYVASGSKTGSIVAIGVEGQMLISASTLTPAMKWKDNEVGINLIIGNGTSFVAAGIKGFLEIPFNMQPQTARLLGDASGSLTVIIKKMTYSGFPTSASVSSTHPYLSSTQKYEDTSLSGWITQWNKGDILEISTNISADIKQATLSITGKKVGI